eukprot:3787957-Rhodomonas_salina.2
MPVLLVTAPWALPVLTSNSIGSSVRVPFHCERQPPSHRVQSQEEGSRLSLQERFMEHERLERCV